MIGRRGFLLGILAAPAAAKVAAMPAPFAAGGIASAPLTMVGEIPSESLLPAARALQLEEIAAIFAVPVHLLRGPAL